MAGHMDEGKCAGLLRKRRTGLRIAEELKNRLLRIRSCSKAVTLKRMIRK
jgi:hypothetical protein